MGKDGGIHVLVFGVDRRDARIGLRLSDHGNLERARGNGSLGDHGAQPVHALRVKHGLHFRGRPGQQNDQLAMLTIDGVQPLPGSRAPGIFKHHRAVQHIGLASIVFRHLRAAGSEARIKCADNLRVAAQANAQRLCNCLARQIIFRGAQTTHGDYDVRASQRNANRADEVPQAVPNDGFENHVYAQLQQPISEEEGICVLPVRRKQF